LSIASEIKTIKERLPELPLDLILQWATINGAQALDRADDLGSFEKGKTPGVVLLDKNMKSKRLL
jgi:cytosine/adenosine deaminase-related metal-dependent hydrolase